MPWTQADVDSLKAAISEGRGVRSLTFADQSMQFHSVDEMLRLLSVMQGEVTAATSATTNRARYATVSKGV